MHIQDMKYRCHRPIIKEDKMAARRITALCKRNLIYVRQVWVKHVELTLKYMGTFFNNGSITIKFHIMNIHAEEC